MNLRNSTRMRSPGMVGLSFLLLAACSCSTTVQHDRVADQTTKPAPKPRFVPASKMHFDASAGAQVTQLTWSRNGSWTPLTAMTEKGPQPALVARDQFGARILTTTGSAGYAITKVDIDCARGMVHLDGTRVSDRDDRRVDASKAVPTARFAIMADQARKACATAAALGHVSPQDAVQELRQTQYADAVSHSAASHGDLKEISDRVNAARRSGPAGGPVTVSSKPR